MSGGDRTSRAGASRDVPGGVASAAARRRAVLPLRDEEIAIAADSPPDPVVEAIDALAFATDPRSERALREGLSGLQDAQVWSGDLRTAAAALGQGHSPRLLYVDVDGIPYPAGAIYELSTVCDVGTVVIVLGSDDTARFSREVLLAGVSDYLVKPVSATAVRDSAARAAGAPERDFTEGWLVGFAGTGGSGTTTLAAATALAAAERGRYVSVLDLNRTFSALSFLLDVEPAGGLVDLLSTVARASLHPEMVDGMRAARSDRIAVYGYQWSPEPPPLAPVWAVCELFIELQRRSHLVIVDGMDDPATRQTLLAMVDARVLVVEPTVTGAAAAARTMARFGPMIGQDWPFVLVQNHTRASAAEAGAHALVRAGVAVAPDVVVPFDPTLSAMADRGWPQGRPARAFREPLATLTERILAMPDGERRAAESRGSAGAQAGASCAAEHSVGSCTPRRRVAPSASTRTLSALRRLLPLRTDRPRPA